jgi:hypothetical protein
MMPHLTPQQLARIAAVGFVVLAQRSPSSRAGAAKTRPSSRHLSMRCGFAREELARCRTITSDEAAALDLPARMGREPSHFFAPAADLAQSPIAGPNAPAAPVKSQDRVTRRSRTQKETR